MNSPVRRTQSNQNFKLFKNINIFINSKYLLIIEIKINITNQFFFFCISSAVSYVIFYSTILLTSLLYEVEVTESEIALDSNAQESNWCRVHGLTIKLKLYSSTVCYMKKEIIGIFRFWYSDLSPLKIPLSFRGFFSLPKCSEYALNHHYSLLWQENRNFMRCRYNSILFLRSFCKIWFMRRNYFSLLPHR